MASQCTCWNLKDGKYGTKCEERFGEAHFPELNSVDVPSGLNWTDCSGPPYRDAARGDLP